MGDGSFDAEYTSEKDVFFLPKNDYIYYSKKVNDGINRKKDH